MIEEKLHKLLIRSTGVLIILDKDDWDELKFVSVEDKNGVICVGTKTLEEFLGVGKRIKPSPKHDYRRRWFEEA